jgi:preprotein translocase subunit YajC
VFLAEASQGGGTSPVFLIMMVLFFVALYFLMIRPQQRRRREIESMQSAIGVGDEIVTVGGLYGTIRDIDPETVQLEIAPGVVTRYARAAIGKVVNRATRPDEGDAAADSVIETE